MNLEQMKQQLHDTQKLIQQVSESLQQAPEGTLHCAMAKGKYPQYYYHAENDSSRQHGRYIKKDELEHARQLAQKEYELKKH